VRLRFRPTALVAALCATALGFAGPAGAVMADPIPITGHGLGHGRGMGQWGSYGYALAGWNSAQILDHFYGGTQAGIVGVTGYAPRGNIKVKLRYFDGGTALFSADSANLRTNITGAIGFQSVVVWHDGGQFWVDTYSGPCGAGTRTNRIATGSSATVSVWNALDPEGDDGGATVGGKLINVCNWRADSSRTQDDPRYFRGNFKVVYLAGIGTRTVNDIPMEQYLRGVVPRESPASWGSAGGQAALEAQAVAARSYAYAGMVAGWPNAGGTFDTCDTESCQVYRGAAEGAPGGSFTPIEYATTDAAIAATANVVRIHNGTQAIARTEFSSSTGGWSAGGTFPAVPDAGDATPGNTNHNWSTTVAPTAIEAAYSGGRGQLQDMCVTARNGLGADGGRVVTVRLTFIGGAVDVAGDDFRYDLGLNSDWFSTPPCGVGRYIDRISQIFTGQSASGSTSNAWTSAVQAGNRAGFTYSLAVSDAWAGYEVDQLYQRVFGRAADPAGRAYWVGILAGGARLEDIALWFYGGDEYWAQHGGTATGFVNALYQDLLHRPADTPGRTYWVGQLQSGSLGRVGVTAGFYASIESRRDRVFRLYQRILLRSPDNVAPSFGWDHWAGELPRLGDMWLAAYLAASDEAFARYSAP
jgi:SpoIID/LytB domain protein